MSKAIPLGLCVLLVSFGGALAQKATTAETTLVGIKLYDTVFRLMDVYGEPDEIQNVGGGGAVAPSTGGGGGGGGGRAAGGGGGGGGGRGAGSRLGGANDIVAPFSFGDQSLFQQTLLQRGVRGGGEDEGGRRAGSGAAAAPAASGGGAASAASYTRWIYKHGGGKYGFILDSHYRVVQIEAIGLDNPKVRTRRGIGFGASFEKVLRTYGLPDSYDVGGDSITMRYLVRDKVVFRLNRLGIDKPHVVTGVLVAAGKS